MFELKSVHGLTIATMFAAGLFASAASANPFPLFPLFGPPQAAERPSIAIPQEPSENPEQPAQFRRQIVDYRTGAPAGSIIIDTPHTYLYFILGGDKAIRYGIGVGREGFTWSGVKTIERKTEWPDWIPPADMLQRQPYLPRFMAGGPGNPLGARAMYLAGTVYRIHGTNAPDTIGKQVSSGCIRMLNQDVIDLYERARVGTKVIVLPMNHFEASSDRPLDLTVPHAMTIGHSVLR